MSDSKAREKSRQFNNLSEKSYNYGLQRETWCKVEKSNNEQHTRVTKKHFPRHNESSVFKSSQQENSRIDSLIVHDNLKVGQYAEKRHFPNKQNASHFPSAVYEK